MIIMRQDFLCTRLDIKREKVRGIEIDEKEISNKRNNRTRSDD